MVGGQEQGMMAPLPETIAADYAAMVLSLRDYLAKTGFKKVLLGLSGGIDSAIVATIAADAIGPENVRCVMLPSRYTSQASLEDAADVARALGCQLDTVSIADSQDAALGVAVAFVCGIAARFDRRKHSITPAGAVVDGNVK